MVRTYVYDGDEFTSKADSLRLWRALTNNFETVTRITGKSLDRVTGADLAHAEGKLSCPICGGDEFFIEPRFGKLYCLCYFLKNQHKWGAELTPYRTPFDPDNVVPLDKMDRRSSKELAGALQAVQDFIDNPEMWLLIIGDRGTGKSNMLQAIALSFGPMALYLSADYFEHQLSSLPIEKHGSMIETIRNATILLLDDWGAEYGNAGARAQGRDSFTESKIRAIINYRYAMWREYPTVVTTNLMPHELLQHDSRAASRLRDYRISKTLILKGLSDYRIRPNRGEV